MTTRDEEHSGIGRYLLRDKTVGLRRGTRIELTSVGETQDKSVTEHFAPES